MTESEAVTNALPDGPWRIHEMLLGWQLRAGPEGDPTEGRVIKHGASNFTKAEAIEVCNALNRLASRSGGETPK